MRSSSSSFGGANLPTRRQVAERAAVFLAQHHPDGDLPVPIEDMIEFGLGIEIRPVRGLRAEFDRHGVVLGAGKLIFVDADDMERNLTRYAFTIAHEAGHLLLHTAQFVGPETDAGAAFARIAAIPPDAIAAMELQASLFAGLVLVPDAPLDAELADVRAELLAGGLEILGLGEAVRDRVASVLAHRFKVSPKVVRHRLVERDLP